MSKQNELAQLADAVTVDGSNVGIGTSSPAALIDLKHNSASTHLRLTENTSGNWSALGVDTSDNLRIYTNNDERMRIDSSGRVTKPNQPAFYVHTVENNLAVGQVVNFLNTTTNVGNHWNNSNNRFVAPVAGMYQFNFSVFTHRTTNTGDFYWDLRINGVTKLRAYDGKDGGVNRHCQVMASSALYMTANQYADLNFSASPSNVSMEASGFHNNFSGYLIG